MGGGKRSGSFSRIYQENNGKTTSYTYCRAEEACLNMHYETDVNGKIGCSSHRACAGANIKPNVALNSRGSAVSCSGLGACEDAIIDGSAYSTMENEGEQRTKLFCYGRDCGKNCLIKEVSLISVSGSMPGAFIDAGTLRSDVPMTIKMRGYQSGMNVTVKARLQTKATLSCWGNACEGLTFDCLDNLGKEGKVCKIEPLKCMEEKNNGKYLVQEGVFCPLYIPSKNANPYEDWWQDLNVEVDVANVGKGVRCLLIVLVPFGMLILYIWFRIFQKIADRKKENQNGNELSALLIY